MVVLGARVNLLVAAVLFMCVFVCVFVLVVCECVGPTRNEEHNTVFYSCLSCFVNTITLNMYVSMSYTGLTRRNTLFIFLWLRHRNT